MKNRLFYYVGIVLSISIASCKPSEPIEVITMNNTRPIEELKELVLTKGDTVAYDELATAYLCDKHEEEYLLYSLLMANKYDYARAYFYVFDCLRNASEYNGNVMDEKTKEMAFTYLKRGAELKDCNALMEFVRLYDEGRYLPKDPIMKKKYEEEVDKERCL